MDFWEGMVDCPTFAHVTVEECWEQFVDAHSIPKVKSKCEGCRMGTRIRLSALTQDDLSPEMFEKVHRYYTIGFPKHIHDFLVEMTDEGS